MNIKKLLINLIIISLFLFNCNSNNDVLQDNNKIDIVQAALDGNIEIVKREIESGADCFFSNTPLIGAVAPGHVEVVRVLLEAGANFNIINKEGETALSIAKERGFKEIEELLLKYGTIE